MFFLVSEFFPNSAGLGFRPRWRFGVGSGGSRKFWCRFRASTVVLEVLEWLSRNPFMWFVSKRFHLSPRFGGGSCGSVMASDNLCLPFCSFVLWNWFPGAISQRFSVLSKVFPPCCCKLASSCFPLVSLLVSLHWAISPARLRLKLGSVLASPLVSLLVSFLVLPFFLALLLCAVLAFWLACLIIYSHQHEILFYLNQHTHTHPVLIESLIIELFGFRAICFADLCCSFKSYIATLRPKTCELSNWFLPALHYTLNCLGSTGA